MANFLFLWQDSVPTYIIASFLIHFINGHLGCFHNLAIVNSPAMYIKVHVSFQISAFNFFFQINSRFLFHLWNLKLLGHMVVFFFFLEDRVFSTVVSPVTSY